jgi:hypothetical protein
MAAGTGSRLSTSTAPDETYAALRRMNRSEGALSLERRTGVE